MVFQSTRPRGARLDAVHYWEAIPRVSIHAPARGATPIGPLVDNPFSVSIHAPARGATTVERMVHVAHGSFNPRARAGRDPAAAGGSVWRFWFQSTRPRGARRMPRPLPPHQRPSFNPRARAGRDIAPSAFPWFCRSFNPRARAGRDLIARRSRHPLGLFQSTRPRGARLGLHVVVPDFNLLVSIHAPARGATQPMDFFPRCAEVSIHAPARGATRGMARVLPRRLVSIHAPARGATRDQTLADITGTTFQSTRPRGARHVPGPRLRRAAVVSIHAPARGATRYPTARRRGPGGFQSTRPRGARHHAPARRGRHAQVSIHAPARGATRRT